MSLNVYMQAGRLAAKHPHAIVSVLDRAGVVTYASPSTEGLLGYSQSERVGQESARFIRPADIDHATLAFQDAVLNGQSVDFGMTFVTKAGDPLPVRCTLYAVSDPDSEEMFVIAISLPINM